MKIWKWGSISEVTELLLLALWDVPLKSLVCSTPVVLAVPVKSSQHSDAGTKAQRSRMSQIIQEVNHQSYEIDPRVHFVVQKRGHTAGSRALCWGYTWREFVFGTLSSLTSCKRQLQILHQQPSSNSDSGPDIMRPSGHRAVINPGSMPS